MSNMRSISACMCGIKVGSGLPKTGETRRNGSIATWSANGESRASRNAAMILVVRFGEVEVLFAQVHCFLVVVLECVCVFVCLRVAHRQLARSCARPTLTQALRNPTSVPLRRATQVPVVVHSRARAPGAARGGARGGAGRARARAPCATCVPDYSTGSGTSWGVKLETGHLFRIRIY